MHAKTVLTTLTGVTPSQVHPPHWATCRLVPKYIQLASDLKNQVDCNASRKLLWKQARLCSGHISDSSWKHQSTRTFTPKAEARSFSLCRSLKIGNRTLPSPTRFSSGERDSEDHKHSLFWQITRRGFLQWGWHMRTLKAALKLGVGGAIKLPGYPRIRLATFHFLSTGPSLTARGCIQCLRMHPMLETFPKCYLFNQQDGG